MSDSGGLTASPLRPNLGFNWVFLVELLVCVILTLFFLFYFNRLFATLVSYGLRAWTWHRYRVYIDVQALQISLLGGRVFFKGLRYHGNNETILIHSGFVTWSYWLRNVRELDVGRTASSGTKRLSSDLDNDRGEGHRRTIDGEEAGGVKPPPKLPCRLSISMTGLEWFVYNRSAAYDAIVAGITQQDNEYVEATLTHGPETANSAVKTSIGGTPDEMEKLDISLKDPDVDLENIRSSSTQQSNFGMQSSHEKPPESSTASQTGDSEARDRPHPGDEGAPLILRFLPVHVDCTKAAVVLGNENTKSVLITKVDRASGEIDATRSRTVDRYKQLISFKLEHPVIQMKPNDDYKEDQTSAASRIKRGVADLPDTQDQPNHSHSFFHRRRQKVWHIMKELVPYFRSSVESFSSGMSGFPGMATPSGPGSNSWQGLSRYLDIGEQDDMARWSSIEYALVSTIVDSPEASMSLYWDAVGTVPVPGDSQYTKRAKVASNINGDIPPEWGINISLRGALINYGPWADRQRADIQRVFFPSLCKDATPAKRLVPGQFRVPTEFKLCIELDEETTLRIPIKEASKNGRWAKTAHTLGTQQGVQKRNGHKARKRKSDKGNPGPEIRPFGWLDVKVLGNATIIYVMDMMAGPSGFSNKVDLDLPITEITTSVNHGLLWRSVDTRISCDLSNPLKWNGQRSWKFDIRSNGLELFILREHVFLLTDLVDDWASGPPPDYLTFSPFQYLVNLHLENFKLYLNVNDSNIINNPSDFDDNTFIIIFGSVLTADICIPLDAYRPYRTAISFTVGAKHGGLNLHVPPWNTQATFLSSTEVAQLKTLEIDGKYQYCANTSTSNTDTLLLNVHGHAPTVQLYGFVIRYFLKVKDNYFGDDIRFKTLEEYQDVLRAKQDENAGTSNPQPHKKSNDLDVILGVTANDSCAILPSNLYSSNSHIRIDIPMLAADLRFTNYYMDLDVMLSTLAFSQGFDQDVDATPISSTSSTQLFVDGVTVSGNRLFGLPPSEPTYVCNWDFAVGAVTGECTTDFFCRLAGATRAFAFSFDDDENALPSTSNVVLHDITFLRANVDSVKIWMHIEEAAFLISTASISVNFNDWAGVHYSNKLDIQIPDLHLACVDAESASRHRSRPQHPVDTHASVKTTVSFVVILRKLGFLKDRQLQQEHIRRHDQRTHRADFLLHPALLDDAISEAFDPPAMCFPLLPLPRVWVGDVNPAENSVSSNKASLDQEKHQFIRQKSSFLSISSSSHRSDSDVLNPQSGSKPAEPIPVDSRSRSLHTGAGLERRIPLRDVSSSTGRQSSFYSAVGEHRGLPPSSVSVSSPYIAPYFPLDGVEPDTKDLPVMSSDLGDESKSKGGHIGTGDNLPDRVDENSTYISFIAELPSGISAFCSPQAVTAVAAVLTAMQAVDPVDILDELQIDSMNKIFELNKQKLMCGEVTDFTVLTPSISLRFLDSTTNGDSDTNRQDMHNQYDLSVSKFSMTRRSETAAKETGMLEDARKSSALHLCLSSACIGAKERFSDMNHPQAAVNGVLDDVVFWMASGEDTTASVVFKVVEVNTASSKVEYLASLLHRTKILASGMSETFSSQIKLQRNRVQLFTYLVATCGQKATDPLFLTRPSYVLRSAPGHLRTTDSWKVVTRLHHMYTSLDESTRRDIVTRCLMIEETVPEDAQQRVLAGFDQWRSWDLNNLSACLVMGKVYGSTIDGSEVPSQTAGNGKFSMRTELVRLILDPGPKQNEISLSTVTAAIETNVVYSRAGEASQTITSPVLTTVAQVFCADISVNLNWELCELADDLLMAFYQNETRLDSSNEQPPLRSGYSKPQAKRNLHIIVATKKGSITVDTINVKAVSISTGLMASFIIISETEQDTMSIGNLMLAAEAATSKIRSHSQELTVYQLRFPSVYASYESQIIDGRPDNAIKVACNCQELSFIVQQDMLALIEVLDLIIGDEVAQLYGLSLRIGRKSSSRKQSVTPLAAQRSVNKINVALFLDMYHISVPILQSLKYSVSGAVARASVAAQLESEVVFDFDIKEHSHDMHTVVANKARSIALLQMPPTNGRVTSHNSEEETTVSIFASLERVELDAAAIHSLLIALSRPEISSVVADFQEDIKGIQAHLEHIFGQPNQATSNTISKEAKPFIYDAHLTFAGFDIFENAQGTQNFSGTARFHFNIGSVQLVIANRLEQYGPTLTFPELRVDLRHILFELSRWNKAVLEPCGNLAFAASLTATSKRNDTGVEVRSFHVRSDGLEVNLFSETASSVVDVVGNLQNKIKDLDLSREREYFRRLSKARPRIAINGPLDSMSSSTMIFASMYSLELLNIQVSWLVGMYDSDQSSGQGKEDLVFSLKRLDLSKRKENSARLTIEDLQLQMVPTSHDKSQRSDNSAMLPEVIFNVGYVSTMDARRLAFQAAGKSLDLRLTSQFIVPAGELRKSISSAVVKVRASSAIWNTNRAPAQSSRRPPFLGKKRMESLLVDADFAGAVVYLSGKKVSENSYSIPGVKGGRLPQMGRYGQFTHTDATSNTILRAPGLAWKVEYKDTGSDEPSLNAEVKVDASSNILYPAVVPLVLEMSSAVKELVSDDDEGMRSLHSKAPPQKFMNVDEENILTADPSAVLGRTKLNLGLRICKQEFSLSCQPIARVAATARFDDIYITINTVRSFEHGHFFAVSAAFSRLQASVQHVYSRESTGSFDVDSVFLSLMNSKHVSGTSGVSAILKISPMKILVNAKQLQDFLLFREIWVPVEIRQSSSPQVPAPSTPQSQTILVQRYQQVAATGAFPWNAAVSIAELDVQLDLGQAIGKSSFIISNFWISSKKNSDWEQNLCLGFDKVGVDSTGRMSGFVALQDFKIRTSIQWPAREMALNQTPLVQGSLHFSQFRVKAAFDYQAFLVADITSFEFLMYNVRNGPNAKGDRLVAILDGEAVQVFCTTTTASQALALYQAFLRLVQEKRSNYEASLTEIEKFMKRKSISHPTPSPMKIPLDGEVDRSTKSPISLHTDVIVTLKAVNVGAFPNTFSDHQVFKLEALNAQTRFTVTMDSGKIHSILGLTLGQLRIGLAGVKKVDLPKAVADLLVEDVVRNATGSRGGTILKVPKVEATMQTWQFPSSNHIDYIFKSSLEGKVEVGWNYSRISYIRGMWATHSKALAQRLGKPLPPSAVKITGVPDDDGKERKDGEQQKITAEVNVPQSKYDYTALEPPIIETPQLRDMGEATPPLEWIGLNRDRLPNLTHQILIVTLLELASEVEDAYEKILGSS